jgi:hypothetical protein
VNSSNARAFAATAEVSASARRATVMAPRDLERGRSTDGV